MQIVPSVIFLHCRFYIELTPLYARKRGNIPLLLYEFDREKFWYQFQASQRRPMAGRGIHLKIICYMILSPFKSAYFSGLFLTKRKMYSGFSEISNEL